jgi:hypothetical protein
VTDCDVGKEEGLEVASPGAFAKQAKFQGVDGNGENSAAGAGSLRPRRRSGAFLTIPRAGLGLGRYASRI